MQLTEQEIKEYVQKVRAHHPTVHCITNIVTVNDCANVVHAVGASPIMAHHPMETAEVAANCDALVCNMGAIDDFEAMVNAAKAAKEAGKPIVIDPVGVGGITYRRRKCKELLALAAPTCIRGNASEIRALVEDANTTVGVDVNNGDCYVNAYSEQANGAELIGDKGENNIQSVECRLEHIQRCAQVLAAKYHCIVVVSGAIDFITDGECDYYVEAGDEMMTRITGTGCMSSVMIGAFLGGACKPEKQKSTMAVEQDRCVESKVSNNKRHMLKAVTASCELMGRCGEKAAEFARECGVGTMSFRNKLIDEISLVMVGLS